MLQRIKNLLFRYKHYKLLGVLNNWPEVFFSIWNLIKLVCSNRTNGKNSKVLLIEPNRWHGETLPGYVQYFHRLGYTSVILCRHLYVQDSPFVGFMEPPQVFSLGCTAMKWLLKTSFPKRFAYVLLTSGEASFNEYQFRGRYYDFIGKKLLGNKGGFSIEHDIGPGTFTGDFWQSQPDDSPEISWLKHHSFVLTSFPFRDYTIPTLNPCFFGELIKPKRSISHDKKIFLTVGKVSSACRNYSVLWDAMRSVGRDNEYELWVIGSVNDKSLLTQLPQNVRVLGHLTFKKMYECLEKAHFFLPLLDPNIAEHRHYLNGCTSGSRQLILGFCLPAIIQKNFAQAYVFSFDNCLIYENPQELKNCLVDALNISEYKYQNMEDSLSALQKEVFDTSLNNLQKAIQDTLLVD